MTTARAVSWPDGAFTTPVAVALTPVTPPPANGYAVQLSVTDTDTSTPVTTFGAPLTLHITGATGLAPSFSTDGQTWTPLPKTAYKAASDGGVDIQTTVPGFFALLPDTVPPTRPDGFAGAVPERRAAAQLAALDRQCGPDRLV